MSDAVSLTDSLIRDYLNYRGLSRSVDTFDGESRQDSDGRLNVDKIIEEVLSCIERHDIQQLMRMWAQFNEKVFNLLTGDESRLASQYETDVYRLYLVRCVQKNDQAKCVEFFHKMAPKIVNNPSWTGWFAFPYVADPKEAQPFKKYFLRSWQEVFMISLHNFFSVALQAVNPPWLLRLVDEANSVGTTNSPFTSTTSPKPVTSPVSSTFEEDLMDDFAVIAQCSGPMKTSSSKPTLKSIFKNITGGKRSTDS